MKIILPISECFIIINVFCTQLIKSNTFFPMSYAIITNRILWKSLSNVHFSFDAESSSEDVSLPIRIRKELALS